MDDRTKLSQSKKEGLIKALYLAFLLLLASAAWSVEYVSLLGSIPSETISVLGTPLEVGVVQVKNEPSLVYFLYENYVYCLFYDNRVWGVRFDQRFRDSVLGVKIGTSRGEVGRILKQQLGEAKISGDNSLVFSLTYQGFVGEVRAFFEKDKLKEIYLYRSDY